MLKNSGSVILWTRYEEWKTCTISVLKPKDIELKSPFWEMRLVQFRPWRYEKCGNIERQKLKKFGTQKSKWSRVKKSFGLQIWKIWLYRCTPPLTAETQETALMENHAIGGLHFHLCTLLKKSKNILLMHFHYRAYAVFTIADPTTYYNFKLMHMLLH